MKNIKLLVFILIPFFLFSQEKEKRLALVIGNSNYDQGKLKNPINDARLIASTLDSLDFDVILKENLSTKRDMTAAIREFGSRRSAYDVAFVYYAGHGVQVDDENFLLPTKETFEEEFDVMDYGVSVQNIMRYLRAQTNQVNILILDACRDNPFESSWGNTRSLKGQGLAKIPPPTGSLIAFSTDSGQTAPDGDGENSVYSISLAKNMLLEDTSIDQVFRNVRAEVLQHTDGVQRPVEATQLTGQTFILNNTPLVKFYNKIDVSIKNGKYADALAEANLLVSKYPSNFIANQYKAKCLYLLDEFEKSKDEYTKLIINNPENSNLLVRRSYCFRDMGNLKNAINDISLAIMLEPNNDINFMSRGEFYFNLGNFEKANQDYTAAIKLNPNDSFLFYKRGLVYLSNNKFHLALSDFLKSETLDANMENITQYKIYNKIAICFQKTNNMEKALEYYSKNISVLANSSEAYLNRALFFESSENFKQAEEDYYNAIKLDRENPILYEKRGNLYHHKIINEVDDLNSTYLLSISDYSNAIKFSPSNAELFYERASAYNSLENYEMSIADYLRALELDKNDELAYKYGLNNIVGNLYLQIDNFESAEKYLKKAIQINPTDLPANFNLANALIKLKKFDEAEDIYISLLKTNQNDPEIHELLGYYYFYNILDYVKAIKYFEKSIKLYTEQIEKGGDDQFALSINLFEISKAKTFLGDFRGAIEDLEKSIKSYSTITEYFHVYSQIGKNFYLMGEIQEAEKFYNLDVEISSEYSGDLADALILRAEFYSSISSIKKADNDFDSASKLADKENDFHSYFIRHKIKSFEYDEALKLSNKAIAIDNNNPIYYYYKSYIYTVLKKYFYALKNLDECIFKIKTNYKLLPELIDINGKNMGISKPYVNRIKIYNTFNQNELICDDLNEFFMLTGEKLSLSGLKISPELNCEEIEKD